MTFSSFLTDFHIVVRFWLCWVEGPPRPAGTRYDATARDLDNRVESEHHTGSGDSLNLAKNSECILDRRSIVRNALSILHYFDWAACSRYNQDLVHVPIAFRANY